jgi:hypothetical protein
MLTLTYPSAYETDGKIVKSHLHLIRQWLHRRGIKGVWFLEFQKRGAPHFHLLLDFNLPPPLITKKRTHKGERSPSFRTNEKLHKEASAAWFRIVGSGDEKHLHAGICWEVLESHEAAMRYAAKHAAKPHQKEVPDNYLNVGRFWGKIGKLKIETKGSIPASGRDLIGFHGFETISSNGRIRKYLWDAEKNLEERVRAVADGGERSEPPERSEGPEVPRPKVYNLKIRT